MVLVVITEPDPRDAIEKMFRNCAYVLIPLSVLFIKYFPDIGRIYHHNLGYTIWTGVTINKNSLGQLCFVVAFFFLWIIIRKWLKKELFNDKKQLVVDVVLLSTSIWLLIGPGQSRSATSFGVFFIGICCFIVAAKFRSKQQYFGIFIFLSVIILLFSQLLLDVFYNKSLLESAVAATGRDMTFTGRVLIWRDLLEFNSNTPWFGKGYGGFWVGEMASNLWEEYWINQGHNGYIDVYVDIGLVGIFIVVGAIISGYLKSMNTFLRDYELGGFKMGYLVMICVYNITESTFIKPTNLLWFIFLLVAMGYPQTKIVGYERKPPEPREIGP
jgi:O-antigen ligase